ncbi:HigA family addiction module antitoxin [Treponema parvum]|uniref:HigA family addiction module antitoxin n=1 Tax=Treponema parvum TaxID=138851 RepID=UPI001AEBD434|nr:HigA family addiction module antitoxin [Treponema parvum]QTQ17215.1 HigA family addiction module antidote protein [Treponema parvum]
MKEFIETPTIGEILNEEFLIPFGLSAYKLAQEIKVPTSRIQDILHNRRKITVDTSLRLAKLFGVSDSYFMSLQNDIDLRNVKLKLSPELELIKTYTYA